MLQKTEDNGYCVVTEKPNTYNKALLLYEENIPIEEINSIQVIKEEKIIKLKTTPAAEYEPFYILFYSTEKEEFTEFKIVKEGKNNDERIILFETTKLVYNYPNTVREITKAPN